MPNYSGFGKNIKFDILKTMQNLQIVREQIDKIDDTLIDLFEKRFAKVRKIGKIKKEQNMPTKDEKRETEKMRVMTQKGTAKGISKEFIVQVWNSIFSESYRLEK